MMNAYQVTFFTEQNRRHNHTSIGEWLLKFTKEHGAKGGTLVSGAEGFDHLGKFHSIGFFELADQPIAVTVSMDEENFQQLAAALANENVDIAYVKIPVELGRLGAGWK